MSTTDLFVELIIIGLGAAVWLVLLVASLFGVDWVTADLFGSLLILLPLGAFIYVLGILVDRVADWLFDRFAKPALKRQYYTTSGEQDMADRRLLILKGERLFDLIEYGRSRLRICRGWALNAFLILLTINLFAWTRIVDAAMRWRVSLVGTLLTAALAAGCIFAWRQLTLTDYRKVRDQAAYLRAMLNLADGATNEASAAKAKATKR